MRNPICCTPHDELKNYEHRIVVFGSRKFDDYKLFSECILQYLEDNNIKKGEVIFLSGMANMNKAEDQQTGADAFIVRWCKENDYPWTEHPADWEGVDHAGAVIRYTKSGKPFNMVAGFTRNSEMAELSTAGISFYDGASTGTKDMLGRMKRRKLSVRTILVQQS